MLLWFQNPGVLVGDAACHAAVYASILSKELTPKTTADVAVASNRLNNEYRDGFGPSTLTP